MAADTQARQPRELLAVEEVGFAYGPRKVLDGVDFTVRRGEFLTLIGPSGCGKTTLLLLIAGLLPAARGEIRIDGRPVTGPDQDRAMVFQNFALLPWKTVLGNVALGLRYRGDGRAQRQATARHYIHLVGLAGFEEAYSHQLSGGMQQRVGLARALAVAPTVLLMDEPFQAIDAQNAELLQQELTRLVTGQARTVIYVTHNLDEALTLSDRILLLSARPARILTEVTVDLPRTPRHHRQAPPSRYWQYRARLWDHLRREVEAHRPPPGAT